MSKNKNTVIDLDSEEQALLTKLAAIKEKKAEAEVARIESIANKVKDFPAMLGVSTFGDVINLIKQVEKGTLGKLAGSPRSYVKLTDEQKAKISERLTKGEQVSALADEYNVNAGTVYGIKRALAPVAATV